jgi:hypothetical protein
MRSLPGRSAITMRPSGVKASAVGDGTPFVTSWSVKLVGSTAASAVEMLPEKTRVAVSSAARANEEAKLDLLERMASG